MLGVLLRKELTDALRDRRTLILMLLVPLLLYPGLLLFMGQLMVAGRARLSTAELEVGLVGSAPQLLASIPAPVNTKWVVLPKEEAEARLRGQTLGAFIEVRPGATPDQTVAELVYTKRHDLSVEARDRGKKVIDALGLQLRERRLTDAGLPLSFAEPLKVEERDVDFAKDLGPYLVSRFLPCILVVMLFLGSLYAAIDVTAGEKERGTLETLLVAPVSPRTVMAAKYLTVLLISVTVTLVNLGAMSLTFSLGLSLAPEQSFKLSLSATQIAMLVMALLPASAMVTGVSLVVASLAKSFREAQSLLSPVMTIGVLPGVAALTPGMEISHVTALVPLLNVALLVKAVVLGSAQWSHVLLTAGSITVFALLAVKLAARAFLSESLRFGGAESWKDLFKW